MHGAAGVNKNEVNVLLYDKEPWWAFGKGKSQINVRFIKIYGN